MRLKTFTGTNMTTVMQDVRDTLGPDAIIVNTTEGPGNRVRITAALDDDSLVEPVPEFEESEAREIPDNAREAETPFDTATLAATLRYHGLPNSLSTRLMTSAAQANEETLEGSLASALENMFRFGAADAPSGTPLFLIGPPGAGKTLTLAKLAASALMRGHRVRLITTDVLRAGAVEQLDHYAQLMELSVETAASPRELKALLSTRPNTESDVTLIDSTGCTPYQREDIERVAYYVKSAEAEPIVVMPSGHDIAEAIEMADIFNSLGVHRMIATRLDGARRLASLLAALYKGKFALAGLADGPFVGDGLLPPTPQTLARLLVAKPDPSRLAQLKKRAAS
ncbi:MAG: hypothetical protein AAGF15_09135 [Pseudomonadota bacterium]